MKRNKRSEWLYRGIALLIAVLLWFFVIAENNPDTETRFSNLDVQLINIDQLRNNGLAVTNGGNSSASLTVRGKRDKIALLKPGKFTLTANVASITEPGTYKLNYSVNINVPDVSVVSESPSQITVTVDRMKSKVVPFNVVMKGSLPEGDYIQSYVLSDDAVIVTGGSSLVDKVADAVLEFDLSNARSSLLTTIPYKLVDSDGNEVDSSELMTNVPAVTLEPKVYSEKTVPLSLNLISTGIFTEEIAKCSIEPQTVTLFGDANALDKMKTVSLGSLNIKSFLTQKSESTEYEIILPDGVFAKNGEKSATVKLETPDYSRKTVSVSSSYFEPFQGYKFASGSKIDIDVFATNEIAESLAPGDFKVSVSHIKDGQNKKKTAYLDVECMIKDVVVFGTYTVAVNTK